MSCRALGQPDMHIHQKPGPLLFTVATLSSVSQFLTLIYEQIFSRLTWPAMVPGLSYVWVR